jgi:hypothetical protein
LSALIATFGSPNDSVVFAFSNSFIGTHTRAVRLTPITHGAHGPRLASHSCFLTGQLIVLSCEIGTGQADITLQNLGPQLDLGPTVIKFGFTLL